MARSQSPWGGCLSARLSGVWAGALLLGRAKVGEQLVGVCLEFLTRRPDEALSLGLRQALLKRDLQAVTSKLGLLCPRLVRVALVGDSLKLGLLLLFELVELSGLGFDVVVVGELGPLALQAGSETLLEVLLRRDGLEVLRLLGVGLGRLLFGLLGCLVGHGFPFQATD